MGGGIFGARCSMSRLVLLEFLRGPGSAEGGTRHWKMQRLTAIALVPLGIWLAVSIALLGSAEYNVVMRWASHPVVTTMLILTFCALFFHLKLGMQVIIEDYIRSPQLKSCFLIANTFSNITLAVLSTILVLGIAL